jgi:hypothetical protein
MSRRGAAQPALRHRATSQTGLAYQTNPGAGPGGQTVSG